MRLDAVWVGSALWLYLEQEWMSLMGYCRQVLDTRYSVRISTSMKRLGLCLVLVRHIHLLWTCYVLYFAFVI